MRWIIFSLLCLLLVGCGPDSEVIQPTAVPVPEPEIVDCTEIVGEAVEIAVDEPNSGATIPVGVYLPPCYTANTDQQYPAIYLLPGGGGSREAWPQLGVYEVFETMLQAERIEPYIIVTPEVSLDVTNPEVVIAETIVPAVDRQFRTMAQRDYRFVGGVSFGGALSWQLVAQYPALFGGAAMFSAAGLTGRWEAAAADLLAAIPYHQTPFFYFDVGRDDSLLAEAARYQALLTEHGLTYTHVSRGGGHETSYWQKALPEYLTWFDNIVGQHAYRQQQVATEWDVPDNCDETTGTIDRSLDLPDPASDKISQPVVVYLPPCYGEDDPRRYPVFYFLHGFGGGAGNLSAEFLDEVLAGEDVPPFIVVMPENSELFPEIVPWLGDVLVPAVDDAYRTIPQREYRGVGGPSRGGGLTVAMGVDYSELFGQLGLYMSAHVHTDEQIAEWLDQTPPKGMPLINISIGEDDILLIEMSESLHMLLLERRIPHRFSVREGGHDLVFWNETNQLEFYRWHGAAFGNVLTTDEEPAR